MPSKDEKHIDPAQIPGVTFYHRVDAFEKVWPDRIEVDWWEFSDFLKGLEPFPLSERPTSRGIAFYPPYATLFLRLDALERELSIAQPNSTTSGKTTASAHNLAIAKTILEFLKPTFDETRSKLEALNSASPGTLVQYDDLWLLYKPGDFIFFRVSELETSCYIVDCPITSMPAPGVYQGLLQVKCWSIGYNSKLGVFSKRHLVFQLDRSQGGTEIARLLYVPARFMEDLDAVKAFTVSRGKSYWEMNTTSRFQQVTTSKQHSHDRSSGMRVIVDTQPESIVDEGQLLRDPSPIFDKHAAITKWSEEAVRGSDNFQTTGFDVETANIRTAPSDLQKIWSTWFRDYEEIPPTAKPDELALMLCSRDVSAFSLREKRWGKYS